MESQIDHLEFVVNNLDEIKMLLDAWDGIAGVAFRRDDSDFQRASELVRYTLIGIVYLRLTANFSFFLKCPRESSSFCGQAIESAILSLIL